MSAKEYERIWRETNAEVGKMRLGPKRQRRNIIWNQVFERKVKEAMK